MMQDMARLEKCESSSYCRRLQTFPNNTGAGGVSRSSFTRSQRYTFTNSVKHRLFMFVIHQKYFTNIFANSIDIYEHL